MQKITLSELARSIQRALSPLADGVWVIAELAGVNLNRKSGHCYLELVEKEGDDLRASMRATVWNRTWRRVSEDFRLVAREEIRAGMKVLLLVEVRFHEVYGLSLNILDIDPQYTLGDMALKRRETIERLRREGVFDLNRQLPFPLLPLRVAVISSETAAGLGDFMNTLAASGYGFQVTLVPAFMQGQKVEESVRAAMAFCRREMQRLDVLVIIRGGGSQVELSPFDAYGLARDVAEFPLPVLIGVGHERDESVAAMVAFQRMITPTATAGFLVDRVLELDGRVDALMQRLVDRTGQVLLSARHTLQSHAGTLVHSSTALLNQARHSLDINRSTLIRFAERSVEAGFARVASSLRTLRGLVPTVIARHTMTLERLSDKIRLLDPLNVLQRGYSLTTIRGRVVTDAHDVSAGDVIETRLRSGSVASRVESVQLDKMNTQEGDNA